MGRGLPFSSIRQCSTAASVSCTLCSFGLQLEIRSTAGSDAPAGVAPPVVAAPAGVEADDGAGGADDGAPAPPAAARGEEDGLAFFTSRFCCWLWRYASRHAREMRGGQLPGNHACSECCAPAS